MANLVWNPNLKLILADVDETIADVYTDATPAMIKHLTLLLEEKLVLFLVTGAGLDSVNERIVSKIPAPLRHQIIIAHCSGAEVCGFTHSGELKEPYYSVYDQKMNSQQKQTWRGIIDQLITEFKLETTPTMTVNKFKAVAGDDPLIVMKADRGPQITLEFVNSYDLTSNQLAHLQKELDLTLTQSDGHFDLRLPVYNRAEELLNAANLPVHPHLAGVFALDFILEGVSKTTALQTILSDHTLLESYNLPLDIADQPELIEIWGDKFGIKGGSDRKMCLAVNPQTRAIDFRPESAVDLGDEFNIVVWDGRATLHHGLEEYLSSRPLISS
jgi:hydroxymethylpyrimidine pyrophosphatase-like HAD family hydrolase